MGVFLEYVNLRIITCTTDHYKSTVRRKTACMGTNKSIHCARAMAKYTLSIHSTSR